MIPKNHSISRESKGSCKEVLQGNCMWRKWSTFFLHHEQTTQIVTYGLKNAINDIARVSAENKWSEKSSKKMLREYDNDKNKGKLEMAMLEGPVVKDAGKLLCTSAYTLEGDSPLILTAHEVFERIDKCSNNGFELPSLLKVAEDTSRTLLEVYAPMQSIQSVTSY